MRFRDVIIEDQVTLGDSGKRTTTLDLTDVVTQLRLQFDGTNGATSNIANPLVRCIDKVELVDGGDVLTSVSGVQAKGFFAERYNTVPNGYLTEVGSDGPYEAIPLNFGRYLYDTAYAFNPVAFRNPQVVLTWNLANVNAVGATGYTTGSLKYTLIARIMEESPSPAAMMMLKEIDQWTTVSSGDRITELPTDHPWCALGVRAFESGVDLRSSITHLKLSVEQDKFVPFYLTTGRLIDQLIDRGPILQSNLLNLLTNGTFSNTWMGLSVGGNLSARQTGQIVAADYFWLGGIYPYVVDHANSAGTNVGAFIQDNGRAYHNMIYVPFGLEMDAATWFPAPNYRNVKLYSTQGNAGAAASVILQQVRGY